MAQFSISYRKTMRIEGGYANNPDDHGGETWRGIARKRHAEWPGWKIVDSHKTESDFPNNLSVDPELNNLVVRFYHDEFWVPLKADSISEQSIADELFDTAVNTGINPAVTFLQKSLNVLNRNQKLYKDIKVDGVIGSATIGALSVYLTTDTVDLLFKFMNTHQGCYYLSLMLDPSQEVFARGWFSRVTFVRE